MPERALPPRSSLRARAYAATLALALSLTLVPAAHAKPYGDRLYDAAQREAAALLASERSMKYRDRWEAAIGKYQVVADKYPDAASAPAALYQVGDLWRRLYKRSWMKDDLTRSLRSFDRVVLGYPGSALADDALLAQADVLETLGRKSDAYGALRALLDKYPRGDMAAKARGKLADLAAFAPKPARSRPPQAEKPPAATGPVAVSEVKTWSNPDYTRVVIYTSGPVTVKKRLLPADERANKPPRLFLDLARARLARGLSDPIPVGDGLLRQVRSSQFDGETVRVVLDIDSLDDHLIFTMENPFRVVVDVTGKGGRIPVSATEGPAMRETAGAPLSFARQMGLGVKVIVLDPGHGGKDPGAVGPTGLMEKDINLSLAHGLRDLLRQKGFAVHLTRETDVFIPLEARPAFARDRGADLFISIHCNANRNRATRGIATYFLG